MLLIDLPFMAQASVLAAGLRAASDTDLPDIFDDNIQHAYSGTCGNLMPLFLISSILMSRYIVMNAGIRL
jgi:hypothetical protein